MHAANGGREGEGVTFDLIDSDAGELPGLILEGRRFLISLDVGHEYAVGAVMVMGYRAGGGCDPAMDGRHRPTREGAEPGGSGLVSRTVAA